MYKIRINSINDIDLAAAEFLKVIKDKKVIAFFGEMGAGKTTFIQALCRKLDVIEVVNSPTFTIVNEYHTPKRETIFHFDFYRIKKIEEVFDFGYEDYFYSGNYCFIEWPELIDEIMPDDALLVTITIENGDMRVLEIE